MRIIGFLCDITGITGKIEKTLDTMDKIETVFFRDVETERGKDATEEVAKKYEIILAEMTGKFKKIMEMMENKKEELSKESDNYLNELEELENKAENLKELLKAKIAENYTYNNSNNTIFQPQSIIGPNPYIFGNILDVAYKRKIKKGEIVLTPKSWTN